MTNSSVNTGVGLEGEGGRMGTVGIDLCIRHKVGLKIFRSAAGLSTVNTNIKGNNFENLPTEAIVHPPPCK